METTASFITDTTAWVTPKNLTVGDIVAFLPSGRLWANRTDAEEIRHGWATIAEITPGRNYVLTYEDGRRGRYSAATKILVLKGET